MRALRRPPRKVKVAPQLWLRLASLLTILGVDRATKWWAMEWLEPRGSLPLFPFFHLSYVENTGAAFGMGGGRNAFFIGVAGGLLALLLYLQKAWEAKNAWVRGGLLLVIGGAAGNLYDRLAYGYVVDFLDFRVWPVFNVADSCVTVGACCLAWGLRND